MILGVTFGTGRGGTNKEVTPNIVPFSVSMLAVVANKVEAAICPLPEIVQCGGGGRRDLLAGLAGCRAVASSQDGRL